MGTPKSNGLVEIVGQKRHESGKQCMRLIKFLHEMEDKSWERWHEEHEKMRAGDCSFKDQCEIYKKTKAMDWGYDLPDLDPNDTDENMNYDD